MEIREKELAKKGYEPELVELLSKFRLWQQPKNVLENIVYSLFSEAIGFWLPQEDIGDVVRSILLEAFHWGSAEGNVYKREDIEHEIQNQASQARERSTIFNEKLTSYGKQIDKIDAAVREGNLGAGDSEITALSQDPALMYFLLDKLKAKHNIRLADWKNVWHACKIYYPLQLFAIFRANTANKENRKFILSFVEDSLDQLNTFYLNTYFESGLAKLLTAIIEKDNPLHQAVLSILKKQFEKYDKELFYLNTNEDKLYRKSGLCDTLQSLHQKSTNDAKEQIYEFIVNTFNLIEDEDDYSRYTPRDIFRILKQYLNDNNNEFFEQRFLELVSRLAMQHERFYRYKFNYDYKGWDEIGNTRAFYGHDYEVSEKQFIQDTLIPALQDFGRQVRWKLIRENCVVEPKDVSKQRPDFLNRVAIPFVLDEYAQGNPEALPILSRYLLAPKTVSDKTDSIYQFLSTARFTDDQKWNLAKITVDSVPVSPLVEQIVGDLAFNGHKQAISQIDFWASDPDYLEHTSFLNDNLIPNIEKLLCHASNQAASTFRKLVSNQSFLKRLSQVQVNELYGLFAKIIVKNPNDGWALWNEIKNKDFLSINEQQLLTGALHDLHSGHRRIILACAFRASNALTSDYDKFATKFFFIHSRELLLQFVERCAAKDEDSPIPSFEIIKRFVSDPDPNNENDSNDPNGQFNYHKQILEGKNPMGIGSVRGNAARALSYVVRPGIKGRMDEVIAAVRSLTRDKNLHVRQQSCVTLARLAANRNAKANGTRFMSTQQANEVESIAFEMLEDEGNRRPALQVAMAAVFDKLQSIDFKEATKAVNYFVKAGSEALKAYLKTIIYFAELRRDLSLEQKLSFRAVLFHLIEEVPTTRSTIAWHMWSLSKKRGSTGQSCLNETLKYVHKIAERFDREAFKFVYYLITDHINNIKYQNELVSVYKECIATESQYLKTHRDCLANRSAPYWRNGEMLEIIFAQSKEEFLHIFKMLSQYPPECYLGDIGNAVDLLFQIPPSFQQAVRDIFENLFERDRNPMLYEKRGNGTKALDTKTHQIAHRG